MELSVLKKMLVGGAKKILDNKQTLNDMNVFPIPDGDTGTNMDKTMSGVLQALAEIGDRELESADFDKLYTGALMSSQGNSGVILSILFRGVSKGFEGLESIDGASIVNALKLGVDAAYKAVMKPTIKACSC